MGNLVKNAIKFTDKGSVRITAEITRPDKETDQILFQVTDTGEGIETHKQQQLLTASQIKNITTRKAGGTGLGLAIVKNPIALFGGEITVKVLWCRQQIFIRHRTKEIGEGQCA